MCYIIGFNSDPPLVNSGGRKNLQSAFIYFVHNIVNYWNLGQYATTNDWTAGSNLFSMDLGVSRRELLLLTLLPFHGWS